MSYSNSTATSLAEEILTNINRQVKYQDIPINGAHDAVQFINKLI
jgi:hypothetical protein